MSPDRGRRLPAIRIAVLLLAAALVAGPLPGRADAPRDALALVAKAREDIARGDSIAAEVRLKQALDQGIPREAVAAYMGEAYLIRDEPDNAREWLGPGQFTRQTAGRGFRALARLEQSQRNLRAAGAAFDRAIAITPEDPEMWVEIGRLRYAGGEHMLALDAVEYALKLAPGNVRALEFRGQLVRDSNGLLAALPWFEAALARAPDDVSILNEYAATLGELGRAKEAVAITRRVLELDGKNARAFYTQAVLVARAGNYRLARGLLRRARADFAEVPGGLLLEGIVEIGEGNYTLASEALNRLLQKQPGNPRVKALLARALFEAGEYSFLVDRLGEAASRDGASPYLMTVVGRAYENLGRRDLAAPLLDRAAQPRSRAVYPAIDPSPIGALAVEGRLEEALAIIEPLRETDPGHYQNQALAGDIQLLSGNAEAALERYAAAARIRMPESLMVRRFQAFAMAGRWQDAAELVQGYLAFNPTSRPALRLAAWLSARSGDWWRARTIMEFLVANGGDRDVQLLCDLALIQIHTGDGPAARDTATRAYRLQRANPLAAQALGLSYAATESHTTQASALLDKARKLMGDSPLLVEGRLRLAGIRKS